MPAIMGPVEIRHRHAGDLEQLERVAEAVRERDGYPPRVPDLFTGLHLLAAWVAVADGEIAGHVALHETGARATIASAVQATGWPAEHLVVVSRLLVAPAVRRGGIGRRLLGTAVAEAHAGRRWPVLDVATHFDAAIALYEAEGWTRAGVVTFRFRDGTDTRDANSFVYVGPRPPGG
jgi:GNAT superfamily N-acetyltransferase